MRMRAEVKCAYKNDRFARAVAKALQPDNLRVPKGIKLTTKAKGKKVRTVIEIEGRIETLLATLDDLLACTVAAESVIKAIRNAAE